MSLLAHAHEYQIIGGHHLNNNCEYNDACTASSKTATDRDYLALAKAYGIIRYFSPNHHTEQWNDDDWFKIGYYYAEKLGREATEDIINEMILVFAPEAYLSSKPKEKTIKVKDADLSSYQYRLHTGGGYISAQGYTPFHKDIVMCSEDMPGYAPEVGKWYSYEVSDRMFLNMQSAAFEDNFYNSFMTKVNEENPKAIIFDVRGYPTYHFQNILAHLNDTEMSNGFFRTPLFALPNQKKYGYNSDNATIKPAKPKIDTPCYFICDYRALSWAETVLMYVKEYDLGIIVGTPTCGTTGDITQFQFPAFCVTMTGLHAAYLDGEQHHGVGVKPDIIVKTSVDDYLNGKDTYLETVIKLINK